MRLRLVLAVVVVIISLFVASRLEVSASSNTTFKQRILPKDCIFTVLDAGTQELFFITPKICEPPPPVNTSTNLELPLQQLVTYEDATGKTTFEPSGAGDDRLASLSTDSLALIEGLTNRLLILAGWAVIAMLWLLLIFTLAFGLPGFRKALALFSGMRLR